MDNEKTLMFECQVCGYIEDDEAPDECPKCGAPKEKFKQLDDATVTLIEKSRRTNDIHMELATVMEKAMELASEGAEENLDPTCVAIFERTLIDANEIKQCIKAELKIHMNKSKWG